MTSAEKLKLKFKKYLEENTLNVEGQDGTVYDGLDDDISSFADSMFLSIFEKNKIIICENVCQCTDCTGTYHDVLDGQRKCEVCNKPLLTY